MSVQRSCSSVEFYHCLVSKKSAPKSNFSMLYNQRNFYNPGALDIYVLHHIGGAFTPQKYDATCAVVHAVS